jgi:hypothetical protein
MRNACFLVLPFLAFACGGTVTSVPGPQENDGGSDAPPPIILPPGPPPNGEVPKDHHPSVTTCGHDRAPSFTPDAGPPPGWFDGGPTSACTFDSDCTAGANGRCVILGNSLIRGCSYDECFTDSDCGANGVCECGASYMGVRSAPNVCSSNGGCSLDSQCGPGGYCSPSVKENNACNQGPAPAGFFCHTPEDRCVNDTDCTGTVGNFCTFSPQLGYWTCTSIPLCAG